MRARVEGGAAQSRERGSSAPDVALTAAGVASATGGRLVAGEADTTFDGVSIDSRRIRPGDLFVAISGSRFDGHDFAAGAVSAGAAGIVVSKVPALAGAHAVILVDDTILALQQLAQWVRRQSGALVVAVTGSAGKTTTKEAAAALLAARYRVLRTQGNLNNHIGLPLSLLELRHRPDVAVVELGMNHVGEVRTLVSIAEPDVRVWTNVAEVHTEFFESLDAVADAKAEILEQATPASVLVANGDDPLVMARVGRFPGTVLRFGFGPGVDVTARDLEERGLEGSRARLHTPAGDADIRIPLLGRANVMNVLAAATVATHLGVPLEDIVERTAALGAATRRGEVVRLPGGVTIVDDSYNSNPRALCGALDVIAAEATAARRIAVVGEMLELGAHSRALHEACGSVAAAARLRYLITVGGDDARALGQSAVASGMNQADVFHARASNEAADQVMTLVRPGDLVLVKGSHGIRTDLVVDRLKAEFA